MLRKRNPILSQEAITQIIEKYCKDPTITYEEIAKIYGMSKHIIAKICKKAGIRRTQGRGKRLAASEDPISPKNLHQLYFIDKQTEREIAKNFGVSPATISNRLFEYFPEQMERKKSLTIEEKEQIKLLCSELTIAYDDIASLYDVSISTVFKICSSLGIERSRNRPLRRKSFFEPISNIDILRIQQLCKYHFLDYEDLSRIFKIPSSTIQRLCQEARLTNTELGKVLSHTYRESASLSSEDIKQILTKYNDLLQILANEYEISLDTLLSLINQSSWPASGY